MDDLLKEIQENQAIKISKYRYDAVFSRFNKNDTRQMEQIGFIKKFVIILPKYLL